LKTLNSEEDDSGAFSFNIIKSKLHFFIRVKSISGGSDQKRAAVQDLRLYIKELEDKRARGLPIISLVDNMVKLGSLYRGPQV
jgi:hypothetical protein